jgi:hypothetical protein
MDAMNTWPYRVELPGLGGRPSSRRGRSATKSSGSGLLWLATILLAGLGSWMLLSGDESEPVENEPVSLATAVAATPVPTSTATGGALAVAAFDPPTAGGEAITPAETAPVDGLNISSQHWRRGGLGSKALVTFTIRNRNDYAITDFAISCAFSRRDGSHLTDRIRTIHDVVKMRSRKTFAGVHVGYVNINANKAKCVPIAARHG